MDVAVELTTPTGAALLAALCVGWGPLPAMRIEATGFGAGTRDLDQRPNLTQVVIGQAQARALAPGQPVTLLEANVDDVTGETLAHAIVSLLEAGSHDAWVTPIVMKKGRPAYTLSALVDPALTAQVAAVLMAETGSLGLRGQQLERWPARRSETSVDVDGLAVRVKVSPGRIKVEHDDAVRAARRTGRPLREVVGRAEEAGRRLVEPRADQDELALRRDGQDDPSGGEAG
ncbi:MAG: LarC family nickel insertion protein [Acidimicrobiales bacterium]